MQAARLDAAQDRREALEGKGRPTLRFAVKLGAGAGPVRSLAIEYAVTPARWWPAYTARLSDAGARARWEVEALVAQDTGEDWTEVKLALSTADLVHDARLPEFPSLRLGKAQPPSRPGYRSPPEGLAQMFEAFDEAVAAAPAPPPPPVQAAPVPSTTALPPPPPRPAPRSKRAVPTFAGTVEEDTQTFSETAGKTCAGAAPAGGMRPAPAMAPRAAAPAPSPTLVGGWDASAVRAFSELAAGAEPPGAPPPPTEPLAIEPAERWLDFDALVLVDPEDRERRGRIGADPRPSFGPQASAARARIDALTDPPLAQDPRSTRGRFDHRYDAEGPADVPSNARPHRVVVAGAEAPAQPRFRTVPREGAEVYRETEVRNPFDAPLLAGPVEVFIDGVLSTSSSISAVDRGGSIRLGLGVEDRLRVARNVSAKETAAGLLGGTTAVDHQVTIDLSSALGRPATVEVIDRLPVTDDKEVEIAAGGARPAGAAYDQSERGAGIRGGRCWVVTVPAGGKARIEFAYQVRLPAKSEIVGGNRRD